MSDDPFLALARLPKPKLDAVCRMFSEITEGGAPDQAERIRAVMRNEPGARGELCEK